tara:strand:+ start:4621 stop:4977 length:357 start_codon:yes stop_codon:yes gene_type:complete
MSPFISLLDNIRNNIGDFFRKHDNFLLFALIISFFPFFIPQMIALIICLVGLYFQFSGAFKPINELPLIITIVIICVLNLLFGVLIVETLKNISYGIFDFFGDLFKNIFNMISPTRYI